MKQVLIIDDELAKTDEKKVFEKKYGSSGYNFLFAKDKNEAIQLIENNRDISLILLDIMFDNMNEREDFKVIKEISEEIWPSGKEMLSGNEYGLPMLELIRRCYPDIPVVMLSSKRVPSILLWCWKHGACYYIMKPPENRETLQKYIDSFSRHVRTNLLVGDSAEIRKVREQIALASEDDSSVSVLIMGESGTGKELIARAIHESGCRRDKPFIVVNCAAIPENLMESELFGHKKGSFTGATSDKKGKLTEADGGVIFFDEVGDLSFELQAKMLRAMTRGMRFSPIGSAEEFECDVQIIAATNKNIEEEIKKNRFREDLFYRLNVFPIIAPPLRNRVEDVPVLAYHFLNLFKSTKYRSKKHISIFLDEALDLFRRYDWPGNVRELENAVEYALVRTTSTKIEASALPEKIRGFLGTESELKIEFEHGFNMKEYCDRVKWQIIKKGYNEELSKGKAGIIDRIAKLLGLSNPSDIQRTILPQIKDSCPDLIKEIETLLPSRKKRKSSI